MCTRGKGRQQRLAAWAGHRVWGVAQLCIHMYQAIATEPKAKLATCRMEEKDGVSGQ